MRHRRLLCAVLALVLLLSAQPTAAALTPPYSQSVEIKGDALVPIISVTVPTSAEVYINPLELPVDIGTGRRDYGQILSTPACIANESEVAMQVDLTLTASLKEESTMRLVTSPTGGSGTEKQAFIYFEIVQSDTDRVRYVEWATAYDPTNPRHIVIQDGMSATKTNVMKLPPVTPRGRVAPGGYAPFRMTGDAVTNPTDEWTEKDGINVAVAFTFTPLHYRDW